MSLVFVTAGIGEPSMVHRRQRGWLKKVQRSQGEIWVLFFRTVRKSDGKRVENKIPIGSVKDFPDKSSAWNEVGAHARRYFQPCAHRNGLKVD